MKENGVNFNLESGLVTIKSHDKIIIFCLSKVSDEEYELVFQKPHEDLIEGWIKSMSLGE